MGKCTLPSFDVKVTGGPVKQKCRRFTPKETAELNAHIASLTDQGAIRLGQSEWASPLVCTRKPGGSLRMCVDYRRVNDRTVREHFPVPRIKNILEWLQGLTMINTMDLYSGYHQIKLSEDASSILSFTPEQGQYVWDIMPFGPTNAVAHFSRVMHVALSDLQDVRNYLDDIVNPEWNGDRAKMMWNLA
eukprot:GHVN01070243.1.p1 GENE.GHVN01070243.1~~GHVN01070243.1.p1  ORF type:complete len:189 (-),score=1.50 GHVN01070243.1:5-571(-)